jgi:valyl-tRNA synthetase
MLLRALHPLAPFITEEIWQRVAPLTGALEKTLMVCAFPDPAALPDDALAEPEMRWVVSFIEGVRQIRGEMDIAPSRKLDVLLQNCGPVDSDYAARNLPYLARLAGVTTPRVLAAGETAPISAVALLGQLEILVPMAGLIDPAAELDRLTKRLRKTEAELDRLQDKLNNVEFVRNAPADVIEKDRVRQGDLRLEVEQLKAQRARVDALERSGPSPA